MASEDEIFEEILKTEVSVDSVLKRIDREEKELQSLKDEKDNAETKEKILAIEESIDEDKKWISMQKQIEKNRIAEEARKESYKNMMEMKSISDKHQLDYKKLPKVKESDIDAHPEYMEHRKKRMEIAKKYKEARDHYANTKSTNLGGTKRTKKRTKRGTKRGTKKRS